jgi:hypothetical protein
MGAIVAPKVAEEAASIWHDGKSVHISRAGHHIRWQQFEKYVEAVAVFLREL